MMSDSQGGAAAARSPQGARSSRGGFRLPFTIAIWVVVWSLQVPPGCGYVPLPEDGTTFVVWSSLLVFVACVAIVRRPQFLVMLRATNPWMLAFLALCIASTMWSPMPQHTFKQAVLISAVTALAIGLVVTAWDSSRLHSTFLPAILSLILASALVALFDPATGIEPGSRFELRNSWRGLTFQKNTLGQLGVIGLIFGVHGLLAKIVRPALAIVTIGLAMLVLIKSRSSTSLMLGGLCCGLLILQCRSDLAARPRRLVLMPAVGVIAFSALGYLIVGGLAAGGPLAEMLASAFGKDVTFSGRTAIWELVNVEISRHPWLGIGYQAFWHGPGSPADWIIRRLYWSAPHAHSGYLDIINSVGFVGFIVFIGFLFRHWRESLALMRISRRHGSLHVTLLIYAAFVNLSETQWFTPGSFVHCIIVFSSLSVSRMLLEYRALMRANRLPVGTQTSPPSGDSRDDAGAGAGRDGKDRLAS